MAIKHKPVAIPTPKPKWENTAFKPALTTPMNAISAALQTIIRDI